jgi:DNA-directed RNA polymerase specialized sigma24 family protein
VKNTDLYNEILHSVNKKVRNSHTAEEITQDTFMDLAKTDTSTIKSLRSYLHRIAKMKTAYRQRDHKNDFVSSIEGMDFPAPVIVDYGILEELLALLSPQERAVVGCKQLFDIDGAIELGISVESFRVIKHRARQKIEKYSEAV